MYAFRREPPTGPTDHSLRTTGLHRLVYRLYAMGLYLIIARTQRHDTKRKVYVRIPLYDSHRCEYSSGVTQQQLIVTLELFDENRIVVTRHN